MAKAKKYYAVKTGRQTGIFESWDECKRQVMGFGGAVYKSFTSRAEAEAFIGAPTAPTQWCHTPAGAEPVNDDGKVIFYVDGSYDKRTGRFSYGMVILPHEGQPTEITDSKAFDDPSLAEMRNVAGEINGSMAAMRWCIENGVKDAVIYYDYEGIAKWALKEWKANKEGTKAYAAFYDSIKDKLNVEFRKVKGHSGDKYNDMADELAKGALGI